MRRLATAALVAPAATGDGTSVPCVHAGGRSDAAERPDLLAERLWSLQSELGQKTRKVRELYVLVGVLAFVIAPLAVYFAQAPDGIAWVWWPAALGVALLGAALPITVPVRWLLELRRPVEETMARELDAWLLERGYDSTSSRDDDQAKSVLPEPVRVLPRLQEVPA